MPPIRRRDLPRPLYAHLLERVRERRITGAQLALLVDWLDSGPVVPEGRWFKRFAGMTVCGEGEWIKTFLVAGQIASGEEI